jgi:hypothetical protein
LEGTSIANESHEQLALLSALKLALPMVEIGGLNTHPMSSASLTQWFQTLEDLSKPSVGKQVFELVGQKINALFKKTGEPSDEGVYPSQVTLLVQHIFFAMTLHKQIAHPSKSSLEQIRLVSSSNDDEHRSIGRM